MRGDTIRIGVRGTLSSFRAATRNPEIPARDYANKSSACTLWTPHRVRGDTMRIGGGEALSSFRATTRDPGVPARDYVNKSPACSLWTPHRVRGDTMRIGDGEALSSFRATTRNPEYPGKNSGRTSRASLLLPLPAPKAGPRIKVRGDTLGHSALRRGFQNYPGKI